MKKLLTLLLCACIAVSCRHENGHTSVTLGESDDDYFMRAEFARSKTRSIDEYMNDRAGSSSNMSFVNTRIDGNITLDNHTTFYVKKYPGFLEIKLDKHKNSSESYRQVKDMCEGIKKLLQ